MSRPIVTVSTGGRELRAHHLDGVIHFRLIALDLFGNAADSDDGVCAGGRLVALSFPFPLRAGTLAASPGHSLSPLLQDAVTFVLTISTLTHFERRGGDAGRLSPDSRYWASCCGLQA